MGATVWGTTKLDAEGLFARAKLGIGFMLFVSILSNAFLWATCKFTSFPVCSANNLRAQYFANFCFPQILIVVTWLGESCLSLFSKE
jgi:hypothetical protein